MLVLAGDTGGTNSRFSLAETDGKSIKTIREEVYPSGTEGLVPLVQRFLGIEERPSVACFAVAGPVLNNKCKLTNLPSWDLLDGEILQQELNIPKVELINDFVAIGYSLVLEEEKKLITLQEGEYDSSSPIGIMGAGTGLGKAFAVPSGKGYKVYPTEGGHKNLAPFNELTDDLLKYLRFYGAVDVERVVSGPGITSIFRFLRDSKFPREDAGNFLTEKDPSLAIAKGAENGNFLCQRTMELFVEAYGAAVGDMALYLLPYGGIYLAGGVAAENVELMKGEAFMRGFQYKARVKPELLDKVGIHICLNTLEGLNGAVKYACTNMME